MKAFLENGYAMLKMMEEVFRNTCKEEYLKEIIIQSGTMSRVIKEEYV